MRVLRDAHGSTDLFLFCTVVCKYCGSAVCGSLGSGSKHLEECV